MKTMAWLRCLLLWLVLGIPGLAATGGSAATARFGLPVDQLDLTPGGVTTALERVCLPALYDTPVRILPDGTVAPHAALQLQRDPEGREYRLTFHPALRWSDGSAVTPAQVIAGWEETIRRHPLRAPAFTPVAGYTAFAAGTADRLEGLTISDEGSLVIRLREADHQRFPTWLADPTWSLCKGAIQTLRVGAVSVRVQPGTGPFIATTLVGRTLTLQANPNHFSGQPPLSEWRWELLGSGEAVTRAYLAGRLDAAPVAATQWTTFYGQTQWRGHVREAPSTATLALAISPRSTLLGRNREARVALLAQPKLATLRSITLAGTVSATAGHFADRLGLAPPPGPGTATSSQSGTLVLAYPQEHPELGPLASRIAAEIASGGSGWRVTPVARRMHEMRTGLVRDWDVALWLLPGPVQPVLAEEAEFTALWSRWGKGVDPMTSAWALEGELIRQGWWRPIGHPQALWLRAPRLAGFLEPSGWAPRWADTRWER